MRLRDGLVFATVVYVSVRLTLSVTGVLTVGAVTPPAFDSDGGRLPGVHNAVDGTNRWDALRFEEIASFGYATDDASAAFLPGYPLVIRGVDTFSPFGPFGSAILAALVVLYGLTAREFDVPMARRAVVLLASFPTSFFFLAPYSESLFLLLTLLTFWWYRTARWTIGGLAGAGASTEYRTGSGWT